MLPPAGSKNWRPISPHYLLGVGLVVDVVVVFSRLVSPAGNLLKMILQALQDAAKEAAGNFRRFFFVVVVGSVAFRRRSTFVTVDAEKVVIAFAGEWKTAEREPAETQIP